MNIPLEFPTGLNRAPFTQIFEMDAFLASWICAALLLLLVQIHNTVTNRRKNLPPGPISWPIVGSLFSLGRHRHRTLAKMAEKYGPLMSLWLGSRLHVIVSSPEMARAVLKDHDLEFANRPQYHTTSRLISHNFQDLIFAPHGELWKMLRRVSAMELFTTAKVNHFAEIRKKELADFGSIVESSARNGQEFNLSSMLHEYFTNLMTNVLFGRKFYGPNAVLTPEAKKYKASWAIQNREARRWYPGDYIPALQWLDTLRGTQKRLKNEIIPARKQFLWAVIEEHTKDFNPDNPRDFADVMLTLRKENKLDEDNMIGLLQDLLMAGTGTSKGTVEWAISELIANPEIQAKAQNELDMVVGTGRYLEESDLKDLPYITAIVKEVLRKRPIGPTGLPHCNKDGDVRIAGYTIPRNTTVLVNFWAIQHDPKNWNDPEVFDPERFLGSDHSIQGGDFDLLPFSSGRRRCVGIPLAMPHVTLTLAYMLQRWTWTSPPGKTLDMAEATGAGTAAVAAPRIVCATSRI